MININLRAAEARELLDAGRVEVVRVMRPQPPSLECCGGLTVILRDVPDTDLWYAAYEADRGEHFIEYRPIPQLSGEKWTCPLPAPGAVVACREPWWHYHSPELEMAAYGDGATRTNLKSGGTHDNPPHIAVNGVLWHPSQYCIWARQSARHQSTWAIRLHARVESRGAEVRDGKWCWVAGLVREEKSDA